MDHRFYIAQLRHLYMQMVNGRVNNTKMAAEGLLGPAIKSLERMADDYQTLLDLLNKQKMP